MPTEPAKIAVKILDTFEAQAGGQLAVSILAVMALATLVCETLYLMQRKRS